MIVFEKVHHFTNNKKKHLDRIDFVKGPQMRFFPGVNYLREFLGRITGLACYDEK